MSHQRFYYEVETVGPSYILFILKYNSETPPTF